MPFFGVRQSWWVYESRAYTGSNMLSRITEAALATMVLAVVNQHHARLYTPLQVGATPAHVVLKLMEEFLNGL